MKKIFSLLFHIMRADFYERIRRYGFFVVVAVSVYMGIQYVPSVDADYITVSINSTRGIYNSAWIGTMFGLLLAMIVPLPGFYLIKVAVGRDLDTGVGQIIASTKVKKIYYLFGKALSNFAVLILILLIMMVIAPLMQIIRGEALPVNLLQIYAPMVLMSLAMTAFVAVIGVLFETVGWLRGGFGNIVYLFLWVVLISTSTPGDDSGSLNFDYAGIGAPLTSIREAYNTQIGGENTTMTLGRTAYEKESFEIFTWYGIPLTFNYFSQRILYMLMAFVLILPATLFFDRFDPAARRQKKNRFGFVKHSLITLREKLFPHRGHKERYESSPVSLTRIQNRDFKGRLFTIVYAEFLLLAKGLSWWWYLVIIGFNINALNASTDDMLNGLMPLIWIWPILVWSKLGSREIFNNTSQIIFSAPRPISRNLSAVWLAGVFFSGLVSIGIGIHLALAGELAFFFGWVSCLIFVPSFAIALSVLSGSHRLFEVVYLLLWFGAINQIPEMDFMSHTMSALNIGAPSTYLSISLGLMIVAYIGRSYQVGNRLKR